VRLRLNPLIALLALAAVVAAVLFGIDYYRHRFVRTSLELVKLLPPGDLTVFFVSLATLRQAGLMNLLAGVEPAAEKGYQEFVKQTQFDYTRDLDALAGAAGGERLFFVMRGRFHWDKIRQYALAHGGSCRGEVCKAPTSKPGRWASFLLIQPDVAGLALSGDDSAADLLRPPGRRAAEQSSTDPVWVKVSPALRKNPIDLPLPMRIFAITLQSADSVIVSLGPAKDAADAFDVRLDAGFPNEPTADATRNQCEIQTKMLKLELTRQQEQPNPADLTGLLTAGSFHAVNKHVMGVWPVSKAFVKVLQ
jgi:hypothetical protein